MMITSSGLVRPGRRRRRQVRRSPSPSSTAAAAAAPHCNSYNLLKKVAFPPSNLDKQYTSRSLRVTPPVGVVRPPFVEVDAPRETAFAAAIVAAPHLVSSWRRKWRRTKERTRPR